jgi:hypothetical protein
MVEIDDIVEYKIEDLKKEIDDVKANCINDENKLNETIKMVNQLIVNVNAANQFIASLHNALADAGLIKKPEEIVKDIKEGNIPEEAKDTMIHSKQIAGIDVEPEPEPEEMDEVN